MSIIEKITNYLQKEIWQIDLERVKGPGKFGIRFMRTLIIAWRGFKEDQCQLKASALTLYTLLSIVPVIALFFGIAKGFGLEKRLEQEIKTDMSYNQEIIDYVFEFANSMLENTKGGLIAGLGVLILLWTVMKVIGNIEGALNDIWEIKKARTLIRKFTDYMAIVLVAPILIILSSSITVFISTQMSSVADGSSAVLNIGPVIYFIIQLIPFFISVLLFTGLYMILPNTRVNFMSAFYGALVAAVAVNLVESLYMSFQIGVSRYNAIYGGFAALPLFLAFVQTNWVLLLLGAELSFAHQNQGKYEFELESKNISTKSRFTLSLAVVRSVVSNFEVGKVSWASQLSDQLQIPSKLIRTILHDLVEASILVEIKDENEDNTFQPAIDLNKLDVNFVRTHLNNKGINEIAIDKNESLQRIESLVSEWEGELSKLKSNQLIRDI